MATRILLHLSRATRTSQQNSIKVRVENRTSALASSAGGGDIGSINSGIVSWAVPLTAAGAGVGLVGLSSAGSGLAPFARSALDLRVNFGEPDASDTRGVVPVADEPGRSIEEPVVSRSLDLVFPNPANAEPKFEFGFLSGDDCRPYGCIL